MIELDVLPERSGGRLILAHDYEDAGRADAAARSSDGLAHLASPPFESIDLIVDLKVPGYELRVLEALNEHGLEERSIVSSQYQGEPRADPRGRIASAARLVGSARAPRLH